MEIHLECLSMLSSVSSIDIPSTTVTNDHKIQCTSMKMIPLYTNVPFPIMVGKSYLQKQEFTQQCQDIFIPMHDKQPRTLHCWYKSCWCWPGSCSMLNVCWKAVWYIRRDVLLTAQITHEIWYLTTWVTYQSSRMTSHLLIVIFRWRTRIGDRVLVSMMRCLFLRTFIPTYKTKWTCPANM